METNNAIINNYANAVSMTASDITLYAGSLRDNIDENKAVIATLNVIVESMRSHIVLLQQALDKYT